MNLRLRVLFSLTLLFALTASAQNTWPIADSSRTFELSQVIEPGSTPKSIIKISPAGAVSIGYTRKELEEMLKNKNGITGFNSTQQAYVQLALEIVRLRENCNHPAVAQ